MQQKRTLIFLLVALIALAYRAIQPPPPRTCGSPGGPPITAPRIRLRDGRHLAYKEHGVPRELAKNKIVFLHGFASTRHDTVITVNLPSGLLEELGAYIVSFDRPGYGESDPDPIRTPKSLAFDVEELADKLGLGPKFYVFGYSMGGQAVWGVLKYIPHRLAGATLLTPVTNYWWNAFPSNLFTKTYYKQPAQDQWAVGIAHYLPSLTYWWITQKWFPTSSVVEYNPAIFSQQDLSIIRSSNFSKGRENQAVQQGESESICRDMIIGFGAWDFDPLKIDNPFPKNEGQVHVWQGEDDQLVPAMLQRYLAQNIPWIQYHELPGAGHMFPLGDKLNEAILKTQLLI
ncbi:hypothetical protein HN51_050468 [Arachis hypogaea]|uniref:AB hydrolase-1 domain-containing protein n=1 Tax=Arachis hypogaea TaxID=3818 RepID=A0A444YB73_ARAHY|nr:uncharacterized protein LOC107609402 [Arachis ipaensis]XP_025667009.1 uncharacterized protein LOC112765316 [Arachis hypogaea]QHN92225.1 uncharacterized protein DS421_17g581830 [Arachis hypogaea]RYQ99156.1 hypothetical protein Ahy_B07g087042 [Arachis hypogaea]